MPVKRKCKSTLLKTVQVVIKYANKRKCVAKFALWIMLEGSIGVQLQIDDYATEKDF